MNTKPKYNFFHRLQLAITGILVALKRERHMKFHILFSTTILTPLIWVPQPIFYKWILVILVKISENVEKVVFWEKREITDSGMSRSHTIYFRY